MRRSSGASASSPAASPTTSTTSSWRFSGTSRWRSARAPREEEIAESLGVIEQGARRAAELANQMLAYAGQGRYVVEPLTVANLVASGTERLRRPASRTRSRSSSTSPSEPTCVEGDASQLLQVLFALVNNAAEAIGDAPGTVSVEVGRASFGDGQPSPRLADGRRLGRRRVRHAPRARTPEAACRPRSWNGSSSRSTPRRRQVAGSGSRRCSGSSAATAAGSRARRRSAPAPSSASSCRSEPPTLTSPRQATTTTNRRDGRGVLVVDDEPAVRAVVSRMLSRAGYTVFEASDGRSGIEELSANSAAIDLVLLDLNMPGLMPDETVQRHPRGRKRRAAPPDERVHRARGRGAGGYPPDRLHPEAVQRRRAARPGRGDLLAALAVDRCACYGPVSGAAVTTMLSR